MTAPGKAGAETDPERGPQVREMVDFARRVADLPVGEWAEVITAVLGPPPVKQPLILEDVDFKVIEKRAADAGRRRFMTAGAQASSSNAPAVAERPDFRRALRPDPAKVCQRAREAGGANERCHQPLG